LKQTIEIASELRSVRSKVEVHDAELDAVTDAMHQLRGKFYAERRKSQQAGLNSDGQSEATDAGTGKLPDPYRDPDGWRRAMQARLSMARFAPPSS
jgi:hypothetical protein